MTLVTEIGGYDRRLIMREAHRLHRQAAAMDGASASRWPMRGPGRESRGTAGLPSCRRSSGLRGRPDPCCTRLSAAGWFPSRAG